MGKKFVSPGLNLPCIQTCKCKRIFALVLNFPSVKGEKWEKLKQGRIKLVLQYFHFLKMKIDYE